jgi:hypothetical protein
VFDAVEGRVSGPLEELTSSEEFLRTARLARRVRSVSARVSGRALAWALHRAQLPAYDDVQRLSRELASVERQVRDVANELRDLRSITRQEGGDAGD